MLLVTAGVPLVAAYLWRTALLPAITGALPDDFRVNYMAAAAKISAGQDPYNLCVLQGCANTAHRFTPLPLAGAQYVTPAPVAWMLQPLLGASPLAQLAVVIFALQLSMVVFVLTTFRALGVRDWQLAVFLVLVAISFEPVIGNFDEGQINLVLAALSGVWLLGWVAGDRWWGGAALGVSVALKLLQAPLALLLLWGRRWLMLAGAAVAGLLLWAVAVPQYLPEYLFNVAPVLAGGTGLFENHSPGGTVARLLAPGTFFGAVRDTPPLGRLITAGISLAVIVVTFWALRRPRADRRGRALEAAAMVAAGPLVASYSWGTHLVLLLLPMFVLIVWSLRRRDWLVLGLVAASWLLIGPGHKLLQALVVSGYSDLLVLRLMAEFGVVGIIAIWVASLLAVRRERSADGLDPADEERPGSRQSDRARDPDAVAEFV
ncbi:MAG TPA: glycosyltransferase 87 family protein [Candidatus Dormibacteraeota bacterium]|nr:glycosyltransferase 87 family protein [Candidatus Dormibacteraeota bacterium]